MNTRANMKKNFTQFVRTHVAETYQNVLSTNKKLIAVKAKKSRQADMLINCGDTYFMYEELENEYITILTEEIYKHAILDFLDFKNILCEDIKQTKC